MITAGFIQFAPVFGEKEQNLKTIAQLVENASAADLIVLPELATTGYNFADRKELAPLAEPLGNGPTSVLIRNLARRHNMVIVLGYAEDSGGVIYNSCMLCTPSGELHNYRKIHLFYREKEYFTPGDAPPAVIDTPAGRIGMMICFDWVFPEIARALALEGAQILAHPSNLVLDKCQRAMFARAVENRVFAITANRIGVEDRPHCRLEFTGGSQLLDTSGQVLAKAPVHQDHIGIAEIEPELADDKNITKLNSLFMDRRPELYSTISQSSAARTE